MRKPDRRKSGVIFARSSPRECQLENLSAREPYRLISVSVGRTSE